MAARECSYASIDQNQRWAASRLWRQGEEAARPPPALVLSWPMQEETADSLQELVRLALDVAGSGADDVELWFRGQGRSSWSLRPSLYRRQSDVAQALRVEEMLFLDFNNRSRMVAERANARGDWELSFLMQHHRLPTRLLDWSRNLLIGAYFAVSDREAWQDPDDPPCVFMFKPRDWNAKTVGEGGVAAAGRSGVISELTEGIAAGYGPSGPMSRGTAQQYALAIAGPEFATRIAAQRGVFTVFGTRAPEGSHSLEEQEPLLQPGIRTLLKVRLSGDRRTWEDALRLVGIGEFAAFPDLDGLARELDAQYFPKDEQLANSEDEETGSGDDRGENGLPEEIQPEGENGDAG
jgi:hypothetical protein